MSAENQGERKKFNFEEMIQLAVERDRQIRSSPFLQNKLRTLNEDIWDNDDAFYNADEQHHYQDPVDEFGLETQEEYQPQADIAAQITELVRAIEAFCASNYNEQENPDIFSSCNQLMSCFYDYKAKGTPGPNFGPCILDIYRKLKTSRSTTLANQYTTESIFDTLEQLNQLVGSMNASSMVHNSFSGY